MVNKGTVLSVDLGGTKLLIGEVDSDGKVQRSKKYASGYLTQYEAVKLIQSSITDYIENVGFAADPPKRMGVGMVGQVDCRNGVWNFIDSRRKDEIFLSDILESFTGMECHLDNDVKAAARAEKAFGGGRGLDDFIYLNIGTGIAAGIFSGGRLVRGWQNDAGEVGHMVVDHSGSVECICGRRGCVEAIASGFGMNRRVKALAVKYPDSELKTEINQDFVRAEKIFAAAQTGDSLGIKVAEEAVEAIMELLLNLIKTFNPRRIILGGGVAGSVFMQEKLFPRFQSPKFAVVTDGIVLSKLNPDTVGLIGAAAVGFEME